MNQLEQYDHEQPDIPRKYSGQWIAWNKEGTEIIAHGTTLTECHTAANNTGRTQPRFENILHTDIRSIGAIR